MPTVNGKITASSIAQPPGPWSSAIEVKPGARYVFTAGLVGVKPDGTYDEDVRSQTEQVYRNLSAILAAADMTFDHIVKLITYLTDIADQPEYSKARQPFWGDIRPAMTLVEVTRLARPGIKVEIEAIA